MREVVLDAAEKFRRRGAEIKEISLPLTRYAIPTYYLLVKAEASTNFARYDGIRYGHRASKVADLRETYKKSRSEGFGDEIKRAIMMGTYTLSAGYYDAYYLKAQQVRTLIRRDYDQAFRTVDLVAMPTSPTPAFRLGERTADPLQMYLADVFTVSANLAGLPAITVPCGFTAARLPVGLQLTSRAMDEALLFRAADTYENATSFAREQPA